MPIGALIGAGTSLIGGFMQRRAANRAAEQQARAREAARQDVLGASERGIAGVTDAGNTAAAGVRDSSTAGRDRILETLGFLDPYSAAGERAVGQVSDLTSNPAAKFEFDSSQLGMDPGYLFRQKEANKTQTQNAAALGNLQSGGFAKAMADRAAQEASQETDKMFGRQLETFGANQGSEQARIAQLMQIMGFGSDANQQRTGANIDASQLDLTGAGMAGGFTTDAARQAALLRQRASEVGADLTTGAGDSRATGTVNASNATTGMLGNLSNIDWGTLFKKSSWRTA